MNDEITTVNSLVNSEDQQKDQEELQTKEKPAEDENLQDASQAAIESKTDSSDDSINDSEDETGGEKTSTETTDTEPEELPVWLKKRLARSKRQQDRLQEQLNDSQQKLLNVQNADGRSSQSEQVKYDPNTQIIDPFTGQAVDIASVEGQVVIKLQQAAVIQEQQDKNVKKAEEQRTLKQKLSKGYEKFDDYQEVVADLPFTQVMLEAAAMSDKADEFIYQLGKYNREEVERIVSLSPKEQFREMVLLENKFRNQKPVVKSVAPPPTTIKSAGYIQKDRKKMSYEELYQVRRKEEGGR